MSGHVDTFTIFGMFRSGTTLLARMLNTHRDIVCASDPYRPFFNYLRYDIAHDASLAGDLEPYDPLDDYFGDPEERALLDFVEDATLERSFPADERDRLHDQIQSQGEPFSPKIIEQLDAIEGETFTEVYDDLLSYVQEAYGTGEERWRATKEVWTTEFVPALARTYPNMRFVLVIRDPRAVCASKNVQEETKYPWLFLIRQWRKIAGLTSRYADGKPFSDRVTTVRYEDLVTRPRATAERLCSFLDIKLDERILRPSLFTDGAGNKWLQNTSYDDGEPEFNTDSVDKWQSVLDDHTTKYIEQLCRPEMERFDYEFQHASGLDIDDELLLNPPMVPFEELAGWIQPYYDDRSLSMLQRATAIEHLRHRYLATSETTIDNLNDQTVDEFFLDREHLTTLRALNEWNTHA